MDNGTQHCRLVHSRSFYQFCMHYFYLSNEPKNGPQNGPYSGPLNSLRNSQISPLPQAIMPPADPETDPNKPPTKFLTDVQMDSSHLPYPSGLPNRPPIDSLGNQSQTDPIKTKFFFFHIRNRKTYSAKLLLCCVNIIQRRDFITAVGQGSFLFPIKEKKKISSVVNHWTEYLIQ